MTSAKLRKCETLDEKLALENDHRKRTTTVKLKLE